MELSAKVGIMACTQRLRSTTYELAHVPLFTCLIGKAMQDQASRERLLSDNLGEVTITCTKLIRNPWICFPAVWHSTAVTIMSTIQNVYASAGVSATSLSGTACLVMLG